jgi:RNA polymerase sigma factor (sigma-70 family)
MPTLSMNQVIQHLRSIALPEGTDLADGQLLECFVSYREPAALEALVRRHGPMVWGVCRRILQNAHDAEDAFQATFLVLVRKAGSIDPPAKVGNWLYGVAYQTALKARATRAKYRAREKSVPEIPEPAVTQPDLWSDLRPVLDQELSRLPEKYRTVIVLCELEGKTGSQAAQQLGVPEGTLASRLSRARTMLANRLTRRGVALSGGSLAAVLAQEAASACVPPSVLSSTVKATTLVAAGQAVTAGLCSAEVAALTQGVLKAMFLTKLKLATAVVLALTATITIAGLIYQAHASTEGSPAPQAEAAAQDPFKPKREDAVANELAKLQGKWIAVAYEVRGEGRPAEDVKKQAIQLTIEGDQFTITRAGQAESMRGKLLIDPTRQPKTMDWSTVRAGEKALGDVQGIYQLAGDTLKHCYGDTDRPSEFKTKPGADTPRLYVWQREKDGGPHGHEDDPLKAPGKNSKVEQLLKERLAALRDIAAETEHRFKKTGTVPFEDLIQAKLAVLKAELDLCQSAKERIAIHEKIVALARELEAVADARFKAGRVPPGDLLKAKVNRLEAEIDLEREKAREAAERK